MGRIVGGVIAGYVAMVFAVFILFSATYMMLGTDGAFQSGSWDVSFAWIVASVVVGIVAAVLGGYLCALIAKNPNGTKALIAVVVVLGLVMALPVLFGAVEVAAGPRPDTVPMLDAMQNAQQPTWVALLNPLLGAVGVWIGAGLRGK